ncbi:MAG: hypothetical protein ACC648_06260, partial [Thiohalobacterales bacterium]
TGRQQLTGSPAIERGFLLLLCNDRLPAGGINFALQGKVLWGRIYSAWRRLSHFVFLIYDTS